jgi:hypothetical protein
LHPFTSDSTLMFTKIKLPEWCLSPLQFEEKISLFFHWVWYEIFVNCKWVATRDSCTIHIYTQTIHRTTQNKQYIVQHKIWEQYKNFGKVRAVPRLGELYPGICLTTEEKARRHLSKGSRTIRTHKPNNKNT